VQNTRVLLGLVLPFLGLVACSAENDRSVDSWEPVAARYDPIVGGTEDTGDANNNVVFLGTSNCTGALIAPNMVLTSRGCVAEGTDWIYCQDDFIQDHPADSLTISIGATPGEVVATGVKLYHDGSTSACGHDLALIQIAPPIVNVTPLKVRVADTLVQGELFRAIGYGRTNPNDSNSGGTRYFRDDVEVLGEAAGTGGVDFLSTQSICAGDGGGPAISQQGAAMGVASRGTDCLADENIWTRTDKFKWLFDEALADVGGSYTDEDGVVHTPTGTGGAGGAAGAGGGSAGTAGAAGSAGSGGGAGSSGTGGSAGSSGTGGTGGASGTGGGGAAGSADTSSPATDDSDDSDAGGCACSAGKTSRPVPLFLAFVVGIGLLRRRRGS